MADILDWGVYINYALRTFPTGYSQSYDSKGRPQTSNATFYHNIYTPEKITDKSSSLYHSSWSVNQYNNTALFWLRFKNETSQYSDKKTKQQYRLIGICGTGQKLNSNQYFKKGESSALWNGKGYAEPSLSSLNLTLNTQSMSWVDLGSYFNSGADLGNNKYPMFKTTLTGLYASFLSSWIFGSSAYQRFDHNDDVPLFDADNPEAIKAYILTGDRSGEIKFYGTDWTVYIDGTKNPLMKVVWHCKALEKDVESNPNVLDNIYADFYTNRSTDGQKMDIQRVKYAVGNTKFSFTKIMEIEHPDRINDWIGSLFPSTQSITFYMRLLLENGESANAYCTVNSNGKATSYGFYENEDESTITVIYGSGENDDGYENPEDESDVGDGTESGDGYSGIGLLSRTYAMTTEKIKSLSGFLWGGLLDSLRLVNNNPIENIVSCKIIPVAVGSLNSEEVVLGNVPTGIVGDVVGKNVKITIGSIDVNEFYGNFLDYSPFTNYTIFLPFIGFKTLDGALLVGKTLKVEYVIDLITGSCKALLFADGIYFQSFDANCGIDIAITSSNRAQIEAGFITSAMGTIAGAVSGNAGAVVGGASSMLNSATAKSHYATSGSYSPSCGAFETHLCYLVIDRPTFQKPSSYGHDVGNPCQLTRSLSSLTGFTVCNESIDLSGLNCTEREKNEIYSLLTSGIYL